MPSARAPLKPRSVRSPGSCGLLRTCTARTRGRSAAANRMPRCLQPPCPPMRPPPGRCRRLHPLRFARRSQLRRQPQPRCPARRFLPRCRRRLDPARCRRSAHWRIAGTRNHRREIGRSSCRYPAEPSGWDRSECSHIRRAIAHRGEARGASVCSSIGIRCDQLGGGCGATRCQPPGHSLT